MTTERVLGRSEERERTPDRRAILGGTLLFVLAFVLELSSGPADAQQLFFVTNTNGSGLGSFRQAVLDANASPGADGIEFSLDFSTPQEIRASGFVITDDLEILGPGPDKLLLDGDGRSQRAFHVFAGVTCAISGITVENFDHFFVIGEVGLAGGGAILNEGTLTLTNMNLSDNRIRPGCPNSTTSMCFSAPDVGGGGIYNAGTVSIDDSILSGNAADGIAFDQGVPGEISIGEGGSILNTGSLTIANSIISKSRADIRGGGIRNTPSGSASVIGSLIVGNRAVIDGGGGIHSSGDLAISNSTLTANSADFGGGVSARDLTITNSTVSENISLGSRFAGIFVFGSATIANTIIASNIGRNCNFMVGSLGHNISSDSDCFDPSTTPSDKINTDPRMFTLFPNGGLGQTHGLACDSPARDAGNNSHVAEGTTTDQRGEGFQRIVNGTVDIGAFEVQSGVCAAPEPPRAPCLIEIPIPGLPEAEIRICVPTLPAAS